MDKWVKIYSLSKSLLYLFLFIFELEYEKEDWIEKKEDRESK